MRGEEESTIVRAKVVKLFTAALGVDDLETFAHTIVIDFT